MPRAKELRPEGIGVAFIEPGAVWTQWDNNIPVDQMKARRESLDALHLEDIAQALVYDFAQPANVLVEEILVRPARPISPCPNTGRHAAGVRPHGIPRPAGLCRQAGLHATMPGHYDVSARGPWRRCAACAHDPSREPLARFGALMLGGWMRA